MFLSKEGSFYKKVIIALSLFLILVFSGCVTSYEQCAVQNPDNLKVCSGLPHISELSSYCESATKKPSGYTFCSDYESCSSQVNEYEINNLSFDVRENLQSARNNLINSYVHANSSVKMIDEMNKSCSVDLLSILIDPYSYENNLDSYEEEVEKFEDSYVSYHKSIFKALNATKIELDHEDIYLLSDMDLYEDYSEITSYLESYLSEFDDEIVDEEGLFEGHADFHKRYFYSVGEDNELYSIALTQTYSRCLSEYDYNLDLCYKKEVEEKSEEISEGFPAYFFGFVDGVTGGRVLKSTLVIAPFLMMGHFEGSLSLNLYDQISSITDAQRWSEINYGKSMFEEFYNEFGPNSFSSTKLFSKIEDIDKEIVNAKNYIHEKNEELTKTLDELEQESETKSELYSKNRYLSSFFGVESPENINVEIYDLKDRLNFTPQDSLGYKYNVLKEVESSAKEYEQILSLIPNDLEIIILNNCNSYLNEHDFSSDYLVEEKEKYFNSTKLEKIKICENVIKNYDSDASYNCFEDLRILTSNLSLKYPKIESNECYDTIDNILFDFKLSEEYYDLLDLYSNYENYDDMLSNLSDTSCINTSDLLYLNESKIYGYPNAYIYSKDIILSSLFTYSKEELGQILLERSLRESDIFKENVSCYFENNYYIDLDSKIIEFANNFPNTNINFSVVLPIADVVSGINQKGCLQSLEVKSKNVELEFSCISSEMVYDIYFREPQSDISIQNITPQEGILIQTIAYPATRTLSQSVDIPIDYSLVNEVKAYRSGEIINSRITGNSVIIEDTTLHSRKVEYEIKYNLYSPIIIDYDIVNSESYDDVLVYDYLITLENKINFDLKNFEFSIPATHNISEQNIEADGSDGKSYGGIYEQGKIKFKVRELLREGKLDLEFRIETIDDEKTLQVEANKIKEDLSKIELPKYTESVYEIEVETQNILESSSSTNKRMELISTLRKRVDKLLKDYETEESYIDRYSIAKKSLDGALLDFDNYSQILQNSFPKIDRGSEEIDRANIELILNESEELYQRGDIKSATKKLESYDGKNIKSHIERYFESMSKDSDKLVKKAKFLGVNSEDYINKFKTKLKEYSDYIKYLNYDDAIISLEAVYGYNNDFRDDVEREYKKYSTSLREESQKYIESKNKLDYLWTTYSRFREFTESDSFTKLENMGETIELSSKSLDRYKLNMDKLTKEIIQLDLILEDINKTDDLTEIKLSDFKSFNNSISSIDSDFNALNSSLKEYAIQSIYTATNIAGGDISREIYIAKEEVNNGNYIDAIYLAKTSSLNHKEKSNTGYVIILSIMFLGLLGYVIFKYKELFKTIGKKKKKIEKVTYYSVGKKKD